MLLEMNCPGLYCGRILLEAGNWSDCGACPRGFRVNSSSICALCEDSPALYDWLYLCYNVLLTLILHCVFIDCLCRGMLSMNVLVLHLCAAIETVLAAIITVLFTDPKGSFHIRSCESLKITDWYTLFYNPNPNYEETLHCTQEAIYPLYSMVFVFYGVAIVLMLVVRPILIQHLLNGPILVTLPNVGKVSIHVAMYFFPQLAGLHALFSGLVYYSYPYLVIVASLLASAAHFAVKCDQSVKGLLLNTVKSSRNVVIVLSHWAMNAFAIVAVTQFANPIRDLVLIAFCPLPTFFYILTAYYTDPEF